MTAYQCSYLKIHGQKPARLWIWKIHKLGNNRATKQQQSLYPGAPTEGSLVDPPASTEMQVPSLGQEGPFGE